LVALAVAVLLYVPALPLVVGLLTWTEKLSLTGMLAFAQVSVWLGGLPEIEQLPPPLCESIDQAIPLPAGSGSFIETFVAGLAPVLATVIVKPIGLPAAATVDGVPPVSAVFVIVRFGGPISSRLAHCSLAPVADTQAVSLSLPASRSACVTVCLPVEVIDLPGASVAGIDGEQLKFSSAGLSSPRRC